ncbi:MAG: hypothetical protein MI919_26705 [Holophagales bacterium]|nr:hypothetical protein [Holophagales bacterium]
MQTEGHHLDGAGLASDLTPMNRRILDFGTGVATSRLGTEKSETEIRQRIRETLSAMFDESVESDTVPCQPYHCFPKFHIPPSAPGPG